MRSRKRYTIPPYTSGWFQMGWSDELKAGQVRPLRQFGRNYVMFRGQDGVVGILDDVCPHLGARLSQGGCVDGASVRCPYHHWAFDRRGRCTDIPYAARIPKKAVIGAHAVAERYGMIFAYRSPDGAEPPYPLPEIEAFDPRDYARPATYDFRIRIHGQDIMENSVDAAHFAAVHGHATPRNEFRTDGSALRITQRTQSSFLGVKLNLRLEFHLIEPGFHYVHFPEMPGPQAHVFSSIVPEDEEWVRHRLSVRIRRTPIPLYGWIVHRFLRWQMMKTYREDLKIWETKEYLPNPVLCDGDGAIIKLRTWYASFYDPPAPSVQRGAP